MIAPTVLNELPPHIAPLSFTIHYSLFTVNYSLNPRKA